jgi:hypothetical protein
MRKFKFGILSITLLAVFTGCQEKNDGGKSQKEAPAIYAQTTEIPAGITTPNEVSTSIGALHFNDGAPLPETAELVYENLDRMRGVDVFLKAMPAASVRQLMLGPSAIGVSDYNNVMLTEGLMDSKPLYLTANTNTMYATPYINMKDLGPMVMEIPAGMLGAFNDAWFRYIGDIGPFGPDKGQGGKFLLLPPGYEGEVPQGLFHVVQTKTFRVWAFMRAIH